MYNLKLFLFKSQNIEIACLLKINKQKVLSSNIKFKIQVSLFWNNLSCASKTRVMKLHLNKCFFTQL